MAGPAQVKEVMQLYGRKSWNSLIENHFFVIEADKLSDNDKKRKSMTPGNYEKNLHEHINSFVEFWHLMAVIRLIGDVLRGAGYEVVDRHSTQYIHHLSKQTHRPVSVHMSDDRTEVEVTSSNGATRAFKWEPCGINQYRSWDLARLRDHDPMWEDMDNSFIGCLSNQDKELAKQVATHVLEVCVETPFMQQVADGLTEAGFPTERSGDHLTFLNPPGWTFASVEAEWGQLNGEIYWHFKYARHFGECDPETGLRRPDVHDCYHSESRRFEFGPSTVEKIIERHKHNVCRVAQ